MLTKRIPHPRRLAVSRSLATTSSATAFAPPTSATSTVTSPMPPRRTCAESRSQIPGTSSRATGPLITNS
nr:hypothetical protein [Streptomyces sp. PT12]